MDRAQARTDANVSGYVYAFINLVAIYTIELNSK